MNQSSEAYHDIDTVKYKILLDLEDSSSLACRQFPAVTRHFHRCQLNHLVTSHFTPYRWLLANHLTCRQSHYVLLAHFKHAEFPSLPSKARKAEENVLSIQQGYCLYEECIAVSNFWTHLCD